MSTAVARERSEEDMPPPQALLRRAYLTCVASQGIGFVLKQHLRGEMREVESVKTHVGGG